jgi:hypothetical protein
MSDGTILSISGKRVLASEMVLRSSRTLLSQMTEAAASSLLARETRDQVTLPLGATAEPMDFSGRAGTNALVNPRLVDHK